MNETALVRDKVLSCEVHVTRILQLTDIQIERSSFRISQLTEKLKLLITSDYTLNRTLEFNKAKASGKFLAYFLVPTDSKVSLKCLLTGLFLAPLFMFILPVHPRCRVGAFR